MLGVSFSWFSHEWTLYKPEEAYWLGVGDGLVSLLLWFIVLSVGAAVIVAAFQGVVGYVARRIAEEGKK